MSDLVFTGKLPRWKRIPWLVPPKMTSWVPLPWLVISKRNSDEVGDRHYYHELAHCLQIERDGWFLTMIRYAWHGLRHGHDTHPAEEEAREFARAHLYDGTIPTGDR